MTTRVQLIRGLLLTLLLATSGFAVAKIGANAPRNCCGTSGCEVLDGYWIACGTDEFCRNYTPNFPVCCTIPGGFCAQP